MLVVEGSATDIGQYDTENPLGVVVPDYEGEDAAPRDRKSMKKKSSNDMEWNPNDDSVHDITAAEVTKKGATATFKLTVIVCCFLFLGAILLYEEEKAPAKTSQEPTTQSSTEPPPPLPPSPSPGVVPPPPPRGVTPPPPAIVDTVPVGCGPLVPPAHGHTVGDCSSELRSRCTVECEDPYRPDGSTNYKCFAPLSFGNRGEHGDQAQWGSGGVAGNALNCVTADACAVHPCAMHGDWLSTCTNSPTAGAGPQYACVCSAGWTGDDCDTVADYCNSGPCQNGAECRGDPTGYQCICPNGWRGDNCEVDYNECILPGLCQHAGRCSESTSDPSVPPGEFVCACSSGFGGDRCGDITDHCALATVAEGCQNSGVCSNSLTAFKCRCGAGFAGDRCELDIDECASHPCQHDAVCLDSSTSSVVLSGLGFTDRILSDAFSCSCTPGFRGKTCANDVNECLTHPCVNGAVCSDLVNDFACNCGDTFFGGKTCSDVQAHVNQCHNGGQETATSTPNRPQCSCSSGWDGDTCDNDVDECVSAPCQHSGACTSGINRYDCNCASGYAGDNCDVDVDECLSHPCLHSGACTTDAAAPDAYLCTCDTHYLGDNCESQVSWCASVPCSHGTCIDDLDTYACNCVDGFEGENCADEIDVCESVPCDHGGTCASHRGAYRCTCASGWRGDNCAEDVDECISRPCAHGGACADQQDAYACRCMPGWFGENCAQEVDECLSIPCDHGGACVDRLAAYSCNCVGGWEGTNCHDDVDECASRPCQNGVCQNSLDTFTCACTSGWSGDKCTVDNDECASSPCKNSGSICDDLVSFYVCTCGWGWEGDNCEASSIHDAAIDADGEPVLGNIERGGQEVFFSFDALPGSTYQIETEILGLPDSILKMYGTDHTTVLAENDDYDIGRDSFLEWTAPRGGTFFFGVHAYDGSQTGDFNAYLTEMPNPCTCVADPTTGVLSCGVAVDLPAASISFMPDGNYAADALCDWTISCPGSLVALTFTRLDTELDYDVISMYDSDVNDASALLGEMSGHLDDNPKATFLSTGPTLLVEFSADESQGGLGFEMDYQCDSLQDHRVVTPLLTDGIPSAQTISVRGEQKWYSFNATQGGTYSIETELVGLEDTVMHLYDTDGVRQLAENDDSMSGTDSYLEWTAPATGTYFVMVHAYEASQTGGFNVRIAPASGNPCQGGITLNAPSAVISFMPDGNYQDDAQCDWSIDCSDANGGVGAMPSLTFTRLDTEAVYDVVSLYDGSDPVAVVELSGALADATQTNFVATSTFYHLQFTADASVGGAGFEVRYNCGASGGVDDRQFLQVMTDGAASTADINGQGGEQWFAFAARQGVTYQIETRLLGLVDSVMHLYDVDGRTQLAENGDANSGRDSYAPQHKRPSARLLVFVCASVCLVSHLSGDLSL